MADTVIEIITYINFASRSKATIDRIHTHLCKSANMDEIWFLENLEKILDDMSAKNLIELKNGAYKVKLKPCQVQIFVEDTQVEPLSQTSNNLVFDSETLFLTESQENQDIQTTPLLHSDNNPAGIYLLKVNNRNTRTRCEICSKLTIKTPERRLASFWCLYC